MIPFAQSANPIELGSDPDHGWLAKGFGNPLGATSRNSQQLHVVAMGKLGGGELNVSSDIDLVFVHPHRKPRGGDYVVIEEPGVLRYFTRASTLIRSWPTPKGAPST